MNRYVYRGDRWTDSVLKGQLCDPVRRSDGKCIVGRRMGSQLVRFVDGRQAIVMRRRLKLMARRGL